MKDPEDSNEHATEVEELAELLKENPELGDSINNTTEFNDEF